MDGNRKILVFKNSHNLEIEEFPLRETPRDKVLVKLKYCAICTWEQRIYSGIKNVPMPFVGGHEMSGTIVEIGDDVDSNEWPVGTNVVIGTTLPCGNCYHCKTGNSQNCIRFNHAGKIEGIPYVGMGGFGTHLIISPGNIFKFHNISFEEATITEPLSCVVHSIQSADIQPGDTVVVIGCGIMGLLHIMLAHLKGAEIIAYDLKKDRLKIAKNLGANYIVSASDESLVECVEQITKGIKAQVVINTTPVPEIVTQCLNCVSNTGRVILYSSFYPDTPIHLHPDFLHKKAISIIGTANSNSRDFMMASRLLSSGIINVKEFISEVYDIENATSAFESACKGDKFRILLKL